MDSYQGIILTARDALILIEAARLGKIPIVKNRLSKNERAQYVRSGAIFAWDDSATHILRWTDSRSWSSSRSVGKFLIYNEIDFDEKVRLCLLEKDELLKQRFTVTLKDGQKFNLISYCSFKYFKNPNVLPEGFPRLQRPSEDPQFRDITFPPELYSLADLEELDNVNSFYLFRELEKADRGGPQEPYFSASASATNSDSSFRSSTASSSYSSSNNKIEQTRIYERSKSDQLTFAQQFSLLNHNNNDHFLPVNHTAFDQNRSMSLPEPGPNGGPEIQTYPNMTGYPLNTQQPFVLNDQEATMLSYLEFLKINLNGGNPSASENTNTRTNSMAQVPYFNPLVQPNYEQYMGMTTVPPQQPTQTPQHQTNSAALIPHTVQAKTGYAAPNIQPHPLRTVYQSYPQVPSNETANSVKITHADDHISNATLTNPIDTHNTGVQEVPEGVHYGPGIIQPDLSTMYSYMIPYQ